MDPSSGATQLNGATFVKMGIAKNFPEYVQRHIKKEMIETPLSNVDQTIGTQANPLDLESGVSYQQAQGEQAKPSQPRHKLPIKRKDHPPSSNLQPLSSVKKPRTQPPSDLKKRKSSDSDSDHAPKPKKPTIKIKPFSLNHQLNLYHHLLNLLRTLDLLNQLQSHHHLRWKS